jgi:hypothetical protein
MALNRSNYGLKVLCDILIDYSDACNLKSIRKSDNTNCAGLPDGIFSKQKIPIWLNFVGPQNGKCWCILGSHGIFDSHLRYFMAIG